MNGRKLLHNAGKVSQQMAKERATIEFNKYKDKLKEIKFEKNINELVQDLNKMKPDLQKIGN